MTRLPVIRLRDPLRPRAAVTPQAYAPRRTPVLAMQVNAVSAEDVADWLQTLGALDVEVVYQARTVAVTFRGPRSPIRVPSGSWVVWCHDRVKHLSDAEFRRQFERETMQSKLIKLIDVNEYGNQVFHTTPDLPAVGDTLHGTPWGTVTAVEFRHSEATTYVGDLFVTRGAAPRDPAPQIEGFPEVGGPDVVA